MERINEHFGASSWWFSTETGHRFLPLKCGPSAMSSSPRSSRYHEINKKKVWRTFLMVVTGIGYFCCNLCFWPNILAVAGNLYPLYKRVISPFYGLYPSGESTKFHRPTSLGCRCRRLCQLSTELEKLAKTLNAMTLISVTNMDQWPLFLLWLPVVISFLNAPSHYGSALCL